MTEISTASLEGAALNFAVGISLNGVYSPSRVNRAASWFWPKTAGNLFGYTRKGFEFSSDYKHLELLLKVAGEGVTLTCNEHGWTADLQGRAATGDTLQIALCRAIVLRELGSLVEVPDEYKEADCK